MSVLLSWQYSTTTVWLRDKVKEMLCCPLLWTACNGSNTVKAMQILGDYPLFLYNILKTLRTETQYFCQMWLQDEATEYLYK